MDSDPQTTSGDSRATGPGTPEQKAVLQRSREMVLGHHSGRHCVRAGLHDLESAIGSRFEIGSGGLDESRQRIAKKKKPHEDQPHIDEKHVNIKEPHHDYYRLERQQGGTPVTGRTSGAKGVTRAQDDCRPMGIRAL